MESLIQCAMHGKPLGNCQDCLDINNRNDTSFYRVSDEWHPIDRIHGYAQKKLEPLDATRIPVLNTNPKQIKIDFPVGVITCGAIRFPGDKERCVYPSQLRPQKPTNPWVRPTFFPWYSGYNNQNGYSEPIKDKEFCIHTLPCVHKAIHDNGKRDTDKCSFCGVHLPYESPVYKPCTWGPNAEYAPGKKCQDDWSYGDFWQNTSRNYSPSEKQFDSWIDRFNPQLPNQAVDIFYFKYGISDNIYWRKGYRIKPKRKFETVELELNELAVELYNDSRARDAIPQKSIAQCKDEAKIYLEYRKTKETHIFQIYDGFVLQKYCRPPRLKSSDDSRWSRYVRNWLPTIMYGGNIEVENYLNDKTSWPKLDQFTNWPRAILRVRSGWVINNYGKKEYSGMVHQYEENYWPHIITIPTLPGRKPGESLIEWLRWQRKIDIRTYQLIHEIAKLTPNEQEKLWNLLRKEAHNPKVREDKGLILIDELKPLTDSLELDDTGGIKQDEGFAEYTRHVQYEGMPNEDEEREYQGPRSFNPDQLSNEQLDIDAGEYIPSTVPSIEEEAIEQAKKQLSPMQDQVWDLHEQLYSNAKIAKMLKIHESTVETYLKRATEKIKNARKLEEK